MGNQPGHPPATLKEVARLSGFGTTAVSRFISGKGYISEEARRRIGAAVEATGYRRNRHASLLKSGDNRQLALIMGGGDRVRAWTRHFFMGEKFLAVVEEAARQKYDLLLLPVPPAGDPATEAELRRQHVAGAVLLDPVPTAFHEVLDRLAIPHVLSNFEWEPGAPAGPWNWSGQGVHGVLTDYGAVTQFMVGLAKERSYQTLAFDTSWLRVIKNGPAHGEALCRAANMGFEEITPDGQTPLPDRTLCLVQHPETALVMHPRATRDPRRLGLVTFNLDPLLENLVPRPAHFLQDARGLGERAVCELIGWLEKGSPYPRSVYLSATFVDGATLAAPS